MNQENFERMLEEIAHRNCITKEQVREEMQTAMEEGMRCPDSEVQQRWAQIPKRGEKLTLEEFVEYMVSQCGQFYIPESKSNAAEKFGE